MNEAVFDFCKATGIELTRSRAYKKNDQAWVEQRNGAIARRLVSYGRLRGLEATETLASLYQVSRLYIGQPEPSVLSWKFVFGEEVPRRTVRGKLGLANAAGWLWPIEESGWGCTVTHRRPSADLQSSRPVGDH
jgi:hypothetical protein